MTVEITGTLPMTIAAHTIYVLHPGVYDVTTPIIMSDCSALIASGNVTLS